ncbi:conserved exported hypothetical protein [Flavobacterium sp. 9AF]|uniref:hypothetical protein n=1 Tax=Flavobacterium sp. 9AF TaxID=2653142 RepID=UPI0012F264BA|nr:hypothetical protein [Flavobacterium sp. 9AF]VXC20093.1 conserved exported hypothetical protein [Flavobacterium sp. 9AF]
MKNVLLTSVFLLATLSISAQNKNVQKETEIVTTTIKDSKGEKKIVKTVETKEVQNVELEMSEQKGINIPMKEEAKVNVTTTTKLNVDGETKFIDVDRSAYYNSNGHKYQIVQKGNGYSLLNNSNKETGVLRKTSNSNYIFRSKDKVSFGYFDNEGNLVLETFDYKKDKITMEKYVVER